MKISIPIFYNAVVNVNGQRTDRSYQKVVEFDLPMARAEDAPVVLQGKGHEPPTYRFIGGSFFVDAHAVSGSQEFEANVFAFLRQAGFDKLNEVGSVIHRRRGPDNVVRRRGEPSPDALVSSDLDRVVERLAMLVGSGVFVNDRLLAPCDEPWVQIHEDKARLVHSRFLSGKGYRPDEGHFAIAERPYYGEAFDFGILRSEFFTADHAADRLRAASRSIASAASSVIGFLPIEAVEPFCLLRDYRIDRRTIGEVIEASETLIEQMRRSGERLPYGFDRDADLFALTRDQWRSNVAGREISAVEQEQDDDAILSVGFR